MSVAMPADASRVRIQPPPSRLRAGGLTDSERNFALAMHLTPLAGLICGLAGLIFGLLIISPLILWLVRKDQSVFNDDHGREVLNMLLSGLIFTMGLILIPIIGWLALAIWYVITVVNMVRGARAASNGEYFRYPMIIRFLS